MIGGHRTGVAAEVKRGELSSALVCAVGVTARMCVFSSESQPPRWGQVSARTLPQRGGVTRSRDNRVLSQDVATGRCEETAQPGGPGAQALTEGIRR